MDPNPYALTTVRYFRRFLSHQRHIALYLASIFGTDCIVGYYGVVWDDDPNQMVLERACVKITLREYLVHSERGHGFLIEDGNRYEVLYNDRHCQLLVNGFWIDCDRAEVDPHLQEIREYIASIKFAHILPPVKREHYFNWNFPRPPPRFL
jgi:hypothetical protein